MQRIYRGRMGYLFIAPLMIGLLMFSYYPAFSGLYHSFFDWDNVGTATLSDWIILRSCFRIRFFLLQSEQWLRYNCHV